MSKPPREAAGILKVTTFPTVKVPSPDIKENCYRSMFSPQHRKNTKIDILWLTAKGELVPRTIWTFR